MIPNWLNTLCRHDVLDIPWPIPDGVIQCCVTSPPYWGLRTYGTERWEGGDWKCDHIESEIRTGLGLTELGKKYRGGGHKQGKVEGLPYRETCAKCGAARIDQQLGLEQSPELYIENMVKVFREVWRVLRKDGVLFLNMGDSYAISS